MEDIINWLEAGDAADYQTGVQLLSKHTKNRTLVNHLVKKDSKANREKLTYELLKAGLGNDLTAVAEATQLLAVCTPSAAAVAPDVAQAVAAAVPRPAVPPVAPQPEPEPEQVPDAVRGKVDDISALMDRLYQERCQKSNLLDAASDAAGAQLVAEILKLQEQYNALAERRRQLIAGEATGQPAPGTPAPDQDAPAEPEVPAAPSAPVLAAVDVVQLGDDLRNVRSNLSKAKGKLAQKPDDVKLQEKVAKLTIEKEQLELQLKKATE